MFNNTSNIKVEKLLHDDNIDMLKFTQHPESQCFMFISSSTKVQILNKYLNFETAGPNAQHHCFVKWLLYKGITQGCIREHLYPSFCHMIETNVEHLEWLFEIASFVKMVIPFEVMQKYSHLTEASTTYIWSCNHFSASFLESLVENFVDYCCKFFPNGIISILTRCMKLRIILDKYEYAFFYF